MSLNIGIVFCNRSNKFFNKELKNKALGIETDKESDQSLTRPFVSFALTFIS